MATENISLKVGLDTSQFNNSVAGMTKELKALSKVDLSILSEEDKKAVVSRMGDLKDGISNIRKEIAAADPGQFFGSFQTLAGPAIASISGLGVAMELFGAKTEQVNIIQNKLMGIISILSTLQTIADANKLKGLLAQIPLQYAEIKNRLTNALLIKAETTALNTQGATVQKLTLLQKLWNAAVAANPILLIVSGIILLTGVVYGLSKAFQENSDSVKESEKTLDGFVERNKELRDLKNELILQGRLESAELAYRFGNMSKEVLEFTKLQIQADKEKMESNERLYDATNELITESVWVNKDVLDKMLKDFEVYTQRRIDANGFMVETITTIEKNGIDERYKLLSDEGRKVFDKMKQNKIELYKIDKKLEDDRLKLADDYVVNIQKLIDENNKNRTDINRTALQKEINDLEVWNSERVKQYEKDYKNSSLYEELKRSQAELFSAKKKEIEKKYYDDKLKLNNEFTNRLIEQSKQNEYKLDEAKGVDTELQKLKDNHDKQIKEVDDFYAKNEISHKDHIKSKEIIDKQYEIDKEIYAINKKKETDKKLLDLQKQYVQQSIEEQRQTELAEMEKSAKSAGASPEQIAQYRVAINKKYDDQIFEYRKSLGVTSAQEEYQRELDLLDRKLLSAEEYEIAKANLIDKYTGVSQMKQQLMQQAIQGAFDIMYQNQQIKLQNELEQVSKVYDAKYKMIDDELKYRQITQQEYDAKKAELDKKKANEEKKLKIKAAKDEKNLALFEVMVNTSIAVMKAYATLGPVLGNAALPWILAQGALQATLIAARPLPQYQKGSQEPFDPSGNSGLAVLHKGEMVVNAGAVSKGNNIDIIRQLNSNPFSLNSGNMNYQQMVEYVELSFQKYSEIPVIVKEYDISYTQELVKNIKVNAEV